MEQQEKQEGLPGILSPGLTRPSSGGKLTTEALVLVCDCGSTNIEKSKVNKHSVRYKCRSCGRKGSTNWSATIIRASLEEITFGIQRGLITPCEAPPSRPSPEEIDALTDDDQEGPEKKPTLLEQGRCTARWSMTLERMAIMRKAMEGIRLMHMANNEDFRSNGWAEYAIELIFADVWAGLPDIVKSIVEEQERVIEKENDANLKASGKPLTKRNEARIRREVRERMGQKLGLVQNQIEESDLPHRDENFAEAEKKASEADTQDVICNDDGRIFDDGALFRALSSVQSQMNQIDAKDAPVMLIKDASGLGELVKHADEKASGHVLLVQGDKRTKTRNGLRPVRSVWIAWDDDETEINWLSEYLDQIDDVLPDADLEVAEILPSDWDDFDDSDKWEMPTMATTREVYRV